MEKMSNSDHHLWLCFPSYTYPDNNVDSVKKFIEEQFLARNKNKAKIVFPHFTTASDSGYIQVMFRVVLESIIQKKNV